MIVRRYPTPRRTWLLAGLLTLLMHVAALLLAQRIGLGVAAPAEAAAPEPIQVVFRPETPKVFTEQPEDRADEAPESPDFLSNVDSRARDRSGAAGDAPRLEGRADFPQVAMERSEPVEAAPPPEIAPPPSEAIGQLERDLVLRSKTRPTMADLDQEAASQPDGGALLSGDISLSTTAWDFAPWMQAFRRAVMDHWYPPAAYHMGMIHGWCVLELDVGRDGQVRSLRVLDDDVGHRSLTSAAQLALEGAAPYRPLPGHFPDESLVIQIRFTYPRLRP